MIAYRCEWCCAQLANGEKMLSLSRLAVDRKPKRWTSSGTYFDSGHDNMLFHESCFLSHAPRILETLYPMGAEIPKKRPANVSYPLRDYPT